MCKQITVFPSFNKRDNETVTRVLSDLKGVVVEYVNDFGILSGDVELPFIETDDGECFFGVNSINKFVTNQK